MKLTQEQIEAMTDYVTQNIHTIIDGMDESKNNPSKAEDFKAVGTIAATSIMLAINYLQKLTEDFSE